MKVAAIHTTTEARASGRKLLASYRQNHARFECEYITCGEELLLLSSTSLIIYCLMEYYAIPSSS